MSFQETLEKSKNILDKHTEKDINAAIGFIATRRGLPSETFENLLFEDKRTMEGLLKIIEALNVSIFGFTIVVSYSYSGKDNLNHLLAKRVAEMGITAALSSHFDKADLR